MLCGNTSGLSTYYQHLRYSVACHVARQETEAQQKDVQKIGLVITVTERNTVQLETKPLN